MKFATASDRQISINQLETDIAAQKQRILERDFALEKEVSALLGMPATERDMMDGALNRLIRLAGSLREARMSVPDDHQRLDEMWP